MSEPFGKVEAVELLGSEAVDAFEDVPRQIYRLRGREDPLLLVSLGAAVIVLTSKFSEVGVQAIDVGYISNCYNNVLADAPTPEELPRMPV